MDSNAQPTIGFSSNEDRCNMGHRAPTNKTSKTQPIKVFSNHKASRDLVVVIKTKSDSLPLMEPLRDWALSRLPWNHPSLFSHFHSLNYNEYGHDSLIREYQYKIVCGATWTDTVWIAIHLEAKKWQQEQKLLATEQDTGLITDTPMVALPTDTVARSLSVHECDKPWLMRMLRTKWNIPSDAMDTVVCFLEREFVRENVLSVGVSAVNPRQMTELWRQLILPQESDSFHDSFTHARLGYNKAPMMVLRDCPEYHAEYTEGSCDNCAFSYDWRDELACDPNFAKTEEEAIQLTGDGEGGLKGFHWETRTEGSRGFQGLEWDVYNARMLA